MNENRFPPNWNEDKVKAVIKHYDTQSEDEAVSEDEAAFANPERTLIEVPQELVPAVRELIANRNK